MNSFAATAALLALGFAQGSEAYQFHGKAWLDYGRVMHAEDTLSNSISSSTVLDYNNNTLHSLGAQLTVLADLSEHMEGAFGFGTYRATHSLSKASTAYLAISLFQNFITQSRLTWYQGDKSEPSLSVSVGSFPFNYNPDVKNLGLYLLRGSVYPGVLMGGFQDFGADSTKSNVLGLRLHHSMGRFSQDLILNNEREVPPTFDWSIAYLAKVKTEAFTFGAGANFFRYIPYDSKMSTPGKYPELVSGDARAAYIEVDNSNPAAPDTVFFTHKGIKLVAMASLDIKSVLGGMASLGPDDLKLYGEAAVIGVQNYGKAYGKIGERIPVMLGFNAPTWGLLDHVSLEVEYYGAKYRNDLGGVGNNNWVADWTTQRHPIPSPKPLTNKSYGIDSLGYYRTQLGDSVYVRGTALDKENLTTDDIKWSLLVDKVVGGHILFMGQIANDHYRPRPVATGLIFSSGGTAEAFASPKDWYYMARIGYVF